MKSSNLQLRKMNLIEYLLGIQDEKIFAKVEATIHKSFKSVKPNDIVFTKEDIIDLIDGEYRKYLASKETNNLYNESNTQIEYGINELEAKFEEFDFE